jgi:hypothetical protein
MARIAVLALLLAALLTGCGGLADEPGEAGGEPPATQVPETGFAETGGEEPATVASEPLPTIDEPDPELRPPAIVLKSQAGRQRAVQGSYCVSKEEEAGAGAGLCADYFVQHPEQLTVVGPGEEIVVSMPGGQLLADPEDCVPACPPTVDVFPLGCFDEPVATVQVAEDEPWKLELEPGSYELQLFAHFTAPDGRSGYTSVVLGVLVDPMGEPAIVEATPDLFVCPPSEQG